MIKNIPTEVKARMARVPPSDIHCVDLLAKRGLCPETWCMREARDEVPASAVDHR